MSNKQLVTIELTQDGIGKRSVSSMLTPGELAGCVAYYVQDMERRSMDSFYRSSKVQFVICPLDGKVYALDPPSRK